MKALVIIAWFAYMLGLVVWAVTKLAKDRALTVSDRRFMHRHTAIAFVSAIIVGILVAT